MRRLRLILCALRYPDAFAAGPMIAKALIKGEVESLITVEHSDGRRTTIEYRLTRKEAERA